MAYSDAAAGEKRPVAVPLPEGGDLAPVVDPMVLNLASAVPPAVSPSESSPQSAVPVMSGIGPFDTVLATELLQRVAWGGDRRRGVARLELGGELAGAVVVVRGEGREVTLELTLPANHDAKDLPERLSARLEARGLVVRELVVR
jgi:hypothetical protein